MTTITKLTKEQLIEEVKRKIAVAERYPDLDMARIEVDIFKIALAALTAEPVAWTDEQELRDVEKDGFGYLFTVKPITPHADPCRIVKLFTVPPAQVVSILDDWQTCEKLSDDSYVDNALRELVEDTTGDNGVRVVQAVIRALRDSGLIRTYPDLSQPVDPQISEYEKIMLQAGNSPVIPEGSFSGLVNSARALLDVLCEFGADEVAISEYVTNLEDALRVAAAPQQEVIGIDLANGKDASVEVVIENGKVISHG